MNRAHDDSSPLQFPCRFPIKAMGAAREDFAAMVVDLVQRHAPVGEAEVRSQLSQGGRYVSVTVTVTAESREQLDAIYRELTGSDDILMVL